MLNLVLLCGCQGVNGGGWAHYVGQEKVRPITGWSTLAFALDWNRPPRQQATTPFWFLSATSGATSARGPASTRPRSGAGRSTDMHLADCNALAARLGWMPSYPTFDRNPLDLADEAEAEGLAARRLRRPRAEGRAAALRRRGPRRARATTRACSRSGARTCSAPRARATSTSSATCSASRTRRSATSEAGEEFRPQEVVWREEAPTGKLDLFTTIDFRMNGSALYSDIVLPAATWYEKHDLSSTDLHPFVHSFNPAIPPPWETAHRLRRLQADRRVVHPARRRSTSASAATCRRAAPARHARRARAAARQGARLEDGRVRADPGQDDAEARRRRARLRRRARQVARARAARRGARHRPKGITWKPLAEVEELRRRNGEVDGRPSLARDVHWCEAILALSGVTNGRLAREGFRALEQRAGVPLADLADEHADTRIAFGDTQVQPRKVIASPEWSGMESRERRYSPFTINVERRLPWRTLTGRQQFYVDHEWLLEFGEGLPVFRPPIDVIRHVGEQFSGDPGRAEVHVRWLSPHSKWSIHSEFQDNLHMLTLFRGGPVTWLSVEDAATIGVARQRLGRGLQPQRRDRLPRGRLPPDPEGARADVPLAGPARERARRPSSPARAAAPTTRSRGSRSSRRCSSAATRSSPTASTTTGRPARSATRWPSSASSKEVEY